MTVEEAILQMNLLGHQFFMSPMLKPMKQMWYTGERRKLCLIEPEF